MDLPRNARGMAVRPQQDARYRCTAETPFRPRPGKEEASEGRPLGLLPRGLRPREPLLFLTETHFCSALVARGYSAPN